MTIWNSNHSQVKRPPKSKKWIIQPSGLWWWDAGTNGKLLPGATSHHETSMLTIQVVALGRRIANQTTTTAYATFSRGWGCVCCSCRLNQTGGSKLCWNGTGFFGFPNDDIKQRPNPITWFDEIKKLHGFIYTGFYLYKHSYPLLLLVFRSPNPCRLNTLSCSIYTELPC